MEQMQGTRFHGVNKIFDEYLEYRGDNFEYYRERDLVIIPTLEIAQDFNDFINK